MAEADKKMIGPPREFARRDRSGRVLVICSCARVLTEMSQVLRMRGFELDIADRVEIALELQLNCAPDSILLESSQFLPEACQRLKEHYKAPVLKFGKRRTSGELHAVAAAVCAFARPGGSELPDSVRLAPSQVRQAQEIQNSLMPDQAPGFPGWELHFAWQPARAVGGDLCWFVEREDALLVALADVQGKDFPAALLTGMMASLLDGVQSFDGEVIGRLNRQICSRTPTDVSIALTLLELRSDSGTVRFCNAGNPPPVYLGEGSGTEWQAVQPALGWLEEYPYETSSAVFEPGKILALHSDGLEGDRLAAIAPRQDLDELLDLCLDEGEAEHPDDRAVILIRRG